MTEKRKRQKFTPEFKSDAVKLVIENGYTGHEVARRLGIGPSNVTRWVRVNIEMNMNLATTAKNPAVNLKLKSGVWEKKTNAYRWSVKS